MRAKLITIFLLTFILFVGALIWRADSLTFGENLAKTEAANRQQISAIVDAFDFEMQNLSNILALSFSELEKMPADYLAGAAYSRFQMLGNLTAPSSENVAGDWQITNAHYLEKTDVRTWAPSYIGLALKSIKPKDFQMGSAQVFAINDPKRNPYLLFVSRGVRQWYVGVLKTDVFQKLMDRQKGQANSVFVINTQGQALGHTTPEYVGKMLSEDPLVAEIMKSSLSSGSGQFHNLKQEEVAGVYEKIPLSNLYVVVTTPMTPLLSQRNEMRTQFLFMGIGLCLIGLAAFLFLVKNEESFPDAPPAKFPATAPMASAIPMGAVNAPAQMLKKNETEKSTAYTKLASTLSHELRPPLTSVLGSIQLALNMVSEQKVIEHLKRADKEARHARDIIQKLLVYAGEDKLSLSQASLDTLINKALKNLEGRMSVKGIKLSKNIQTVSAFELPAELLVRSFESILANSIEAMERAPQKNLTVQLEQQGSDIILSIADSGEGMDAETVAKVFDPFFSTRAQGQHVGLGLSTAKGVIKESHGDIKIESEKGKGTKVIISFNPQANEVARADVPAARGKDEITRSSVTIEALSDSKSSASISVPLLVDTSIDHLIDGAEPEELNLLETKKLTGGQEKDLPAAPAPELIEEKTVSIEPVSPTTSSSIKIDRPQMDLKKKTSKLDEAPIAIRRPGEKV